MRRRYQVPIRKGGVYRHHGRLVKLLEPDFVMGPGYWKAELMSSSEERLVHVVDLEPIAEIKRAKDGGI